MGGKDLTPFGNALAGAIGGVISNAVVYPLDTVKTKIQAQTDELVSEKDSLPSPQLKRPNAPNRLPAACRSTAFQVVLQVLKSQGIGGFYRGFLASMLNTFSMQFAYFYWYMVVRKTYTTRVLPKSSGAGPSKAPNLSIITELSLGALAGAIAQIFTIPVSVVATRQQLDNSKTGGKSLLTTASEIIRDDGPAGLWRGLKPSLVLTVNPAITYGSFERLKLIVLGPEGKMTPGKAFWMGALSKTLATVITYPYIMAKVRLQAKYDTPTSDDHSQASEKSSPSKKLPPPKERYSGAIDVLRQVYAEKGCSGWYQGMQAQIMKAVLSQALLFGIKDILEDYTVLLLILASNLRKTQLSKLPK
ncbi:ADP/ATP carrier protein [Puccinia graminis f. sp. tritici]|uniref:ADP/ATP carrier protein n=1 Tax=Puccinia graminis f. sp. tritici TaxID=56615 RepID=A0A5B0R2U9_PUCGR|nr:ADP/ATP carrier protein [Puccinia graminis f. sp. tritici]